MVQYAMNCFLMKKVKTLLYSNASSHDGKDLLALILRVAWDRLAEIETLTQSHHCSSYRCILSSPILWQSYSICLNTEPLYLIPLIDVDPCLQYPCHRLPQSVCKCHIWKYSQGPICQPSISPYSTQH